MSFHPTLGSELQIFLNVSLLLSNCMNKDMNKMGRGRAPERGRKDLGRITYIQEIISKDELGAASLRDSIRVRTHTRY